MSIQCQTTAEVLITNTPPNTLGNTIEKRYKAAFRGVNDKDKEEFKHSKVIVPISVGQKYHEGGEFEAIMKLVDKSFKECVILVGDSLRRHSPEIFMQAHNKADARALAKQEGSLWLKNNLKYIERLSIPHSVIRWDAWISHPDFDHYYNTVCKLYESDKHYKNIVHEVVNAFLFRGKRNGNREWFPSCASYFLEESAGVCLWIKNGFKYNVYPSGDNKAIACTCEQLMKPDGYEYMSLALNLRRLSN